MSSAPESIRRSLRPTIAEISLGSFRRNVETIRSRLPARSRLIPVIKADAYGHGAVPIARECERLGIHMLAVALVEEAIELREAGIRADLFVSGPLSVEEIEVCVERGFHVGISTIDSLEDLRGILTPTGRTAHIHLKVDSGMGRLGLLEDELGHAASLLSSMPEARIEAIYTHFASSSNPDDPFTDSQIRWFRRMVEQLRRDGVEAPIEHSASSAAVMRGLVDAGDYVRVGLSIYGGEPLERGDSRLEPVLRWTTRVTRMRHLPVGHCVGYGCTYTTIRPSTIVQLPVGYADGFNRLLSNNGDVLIRGRRASVIGTISMDIVTVDVTDIPDVAPGDEVVLIGRQGDEWITAEEIAARIGTISYEILTRIGQRVPRIWTD